MIMWYPEGQSRAEPLPCMFKLVCVDINDTAASKVFTEMYTLLSSYTCYALLFYIAGLKTFVVTKTGIY